jgi:arylsulfatase A-like enzyme
MPMQRGFDHQYGHYSALIDSFTHIRGAVYDWHRNEWPLNEEGYSTFLIAAELERLLQHRDKSKPFFFYVPFNAVHGPHQAPQGFLAKYGGRDAAQNAQLECMDIAIGRILNALDKKGLCDNTLMIFFNDNGGRERLGNGPYRGGKGSYYEGGIRVACLMRWPAKIKPGSVVDEPVHVVDLYPTLINQAGGSLKQRLPLDGLDVWATIIQGKPSPRREIVHNVPGSARSDTAAIRRGDFKLVGDQLFNIKDDPYEQNDLAGKYPEKVRELKGRLAQLARERRKPEQHLKIPDYPPTVYGEHENKGQLPAWLLEKAQNARQNENAIRSEQRAKWQRRNSK